MFWAEKTAYTTIVLFQKQVFQFTEQLDSMGNVNKIVIFKI